MRIEEEFIPKDFEACISILLTAAEAKNILLDLASESKQHRESTNIFKKEMTEFLLRVRSGGSDQK